MTQKNLLNVDGYQLIARSDSLIYQTNLGHRYQLTNQNKPVPIPITGDINIDNLSVKNLIQVNNDVLISGNSVKQLFNTDIKKYSSFTPGKQLTTTIIPNTDRKFYFANLTQARQYNYKIQEFTQVPIGFNQIKIGFIMSNPSASINIQNVNWVRYQNCIPLDLVAGKSKTFNFPCFSNNYMNVVHIQWLYDNQWIGRLFYKIKIK